jgi:hypothetical protein
MSEKIIFGLRDLLTDNDVEIPSDLHTLSQEGEMSALLDLIYINNLHRYFTTPDPISGAVGGVMRPEVVQAERYLNLRESTEAAYAKKSIDY